MVKNKRSSLILLLLTLLFIFNLVDTGFTYQVVVIDGGREFNPLMKWLLELSPLAFVIIKFVGMSLIIWFLWRRQALITTIAAFSIYFANFLFQLWQIIYLV